MRQLDNQASALTSDINNPVVLHIFMFKAKFLSRMRLSDSIQNIQVVTIGILWWHDTVIISNIILILYYYYY